MTERIEVVSPKREARLAGVFEALEGLGSAFGQVIVFNRLIVVGNAPATAANLLGHEGQVWLAFASSMIAVVFHLAWALLFHRLLRPLNRAVSTLAVYVILVGCAIQALSSVLIVGPLLVLKAGSAVSAFPPAQLQALAYVFVRLNGHAFNTYLVFFGCWCVLVGWLAARSTFLPRILGVLLVIDGLGWMLFLHPPLARQLFTWIAAASGLAEIPLLLWLLVKGVDAERWREQAGAAGR